jgi:integrase
MARNPSKRAPLKQEAGPGRHRDFPLSIHKGTGRWCKKVRQRTVYFGSVQDDPTGQAALERWLEQKDALLAGRKPTTKPTGCTIESLCNAFMDSKQLLADSGELAPRSLDDYHRIAKLVAAQFGKWRSVDDLTPADFEQLRAKLAKRLSHASVGDTVNRIRVLFNYGYNAGLLERPVRFGLTFKRPKARLLRLERSRKGSRMFEAAEIRALLQACRNPKLRAMILLGVNAGLGNTDCGSLELRHIDLDSLWMNYPRPKTGVDRRAYLWPETAEALREVIATRADDGLVFVTNRGNSFNKEIADNPIAKEFGKLMRSAGIDRPGVGFYGLRRTFETIGGDTADQVAVDYIMGHAPANDDMAAVYRQRINDERLQAVATHVRSWLFDEVTS